MYLELELKENQLKQLESSNWNIWNIKNKI